MTALPPAPLSTTSQGALPKANPLCSHHIAEHFRCKSDAVDREVRGAHSRVGQGYPGDHLVLTEPDGRIRAYLQATVVTETYMSSGQIATYFDISAAGVDTSIGQSSDFLILIRQAARIYYLRQQLWHSLLAGIRVLPIEIHIDPRTGATEAFVTHLGKLASTLRSMGFEEYPPNREYLWLRRDRPLRLSR